VTAQHRAIGYMAKKFQRVFKARTFNERVVMCDGQLE
jgi:hypothetical protein